MVAGVGIGAGAPRHETGERGRFPAHSNGNLGARAAAHTRPPCAQCGSATEAQSRDRIAPTFTHTCCRAKSEYWNPSSINRRRQEL
jgi:hypothetical protein